MTCHLLVCLDPQNHELVAPLLPHQFPHHTAQVLPRVARGGAGEAGEGRLAMDRMILRELGPAQTIKLNEVLKEVFDS